MFRSIPACAGETIGPRFRPNLDRVDPRVRGGDFFRCALLSLLLGRSPRARGRPLKHPGRRVKVGSIPACAGETRGIRPLRRRQRVDPRVRGGDGWAYARESGAAGRSPRARGRPRRKLIENDQTRSIPACAGETIFCVLWIVMAWVDPRVRGGDEPCAFLF